MKPKIRRELIEWTVMITIFGVIYLGGWHTEVIGRLQQAVLSTGIISPTQVSEKKKASYDFDLETIDGESFSFNKMKDQVVFVNFWATWCPPCVAEMPDIQALYDDKGKEVAFVMISLDQDEEKAKDFIERKGFDFPVYFLRSPLPETYDTHSIPTTYVIGTDGLIKVENHGMAKYSSDSFKEFLDGLVDK
ncbi:MAG: TlpA family protein disulfide reductase [Ekhidna sp.]